MTTLLTDIAVAHVNHGRWIADCIRRDCGGAEALKLGQPEVVCANCGLVMPIVWPPDAGLIAAVLMKRPVPQTRNWAPAGHWQAVASGHPDGQTVADLTAENIAHGVV